MKNVLTFICSIMFIFMLVASTAGATLITNHFYLEIDSIVSSDTDHPYEGFGAKKMSVGDRYYGHVKYDDRNLPDSGSFIIAHSWLHDEYGTSSSTADEYQYWAVDSDPMLSEFFHGAMYGYGMDWTPPCLLFEDGELVGMSIRYDPDLEVIHHDDMRIQGVHFSDWGDYFAGDYVGYCTVTGTLHTIPEPVAMILIGTGFIWLAGFGNKKYKS